MRAAFSIFTALAVLPLLNSCDLAFASSETTMWLSPDALLGIVVVQKGNEYEAAMYMFDEKASMPKPESIDPAVDETIGGMPFSSGVADLETNTLCFPLKNVNLVASNSARLMRENGSPYVEFDLADLSKQEIVGRWRKGDTKATMTRTFIRCGPPAPAAE